MSKTYKSSKLLEKLKTSRIISFVLILFGVPTLFSSDISEVSSFAEVGSLLDGIIPLVFGVILFFAMHRKIKTVESNFISFDDNQLSFSSRGISNSFDEISEIKSIEIKLKTITLTDEQLNTFIIYMDDYTEFKDKKSIKSEFSKLQSKILTMHNIK